MKRLKTVTIIGGGECTAEERRLAEEVGYQLASQGVVIVTGGRGGVMEAASSGARKAGGIALGILPGDDHQGGNDFLSIGIPTGLGSGRNAIVARASQVVIAIGGGYGTLSEIGLAMKSDRKVIGLGTWSAKDGHGKGIDIIVAQSADEAVNLALHEIGL